MKGSIARGKEHDDEETPTPEPLCLQSESGLTRLASNPKKAMLEQAALEIALELRFDVTRQRPVLGRPTIAKPRIVLGHELIEQRRLRPMPPIPRRIDKLLDGAENVDLIPDEVAIRALMQTLRVPSDAPQGVAEFEKTLYNEEICRTPWLENVNTTFHASCSAVSFTIRRRGRSARGSIGAAQKHGWSAFETLD